MPALQITHIRDYASQILSVLRIFAASSFFTYGTMKLFNWPAPFEYPLSPSRCTAGVLEAVGGDALAVGLLSRPVAFVLSGLMAFAYFMVHSSNAFFPVLNHGEAAMLYCFLFLYISAAGPGAWSLDAFQDRKAGPSPPGLESAGQQYRL
jgi:putative oxidoreductase